MKALRVLAAALAVGLVAGSAWAADEALALRTRAEQLAADDRCEQALPRARRARQLDPSDARAALVEGRCLLRLGLYRDALAPLAEARELDASLAGVSTDLAQCHYHLDELEAANAELDRAEAQDPDDARMHLYRGLVLLRASKQAEAAEAFDRAGRLDPTLAEVAGLYSGRTWAAIRDRERASAALERARRAAPGSDWALAAERELEQLDAPYKRYRWAQVRGGIEHDSNVALRIPGSADPISQAILGDFEFDERQDMRGFFDAEIGGEFLRNPDNSLGMIVGYDGNAHTDLHEFDLQYPWLTFWYDRRLDEDTWIRLQPFGGYAWLETDPFVIHGGATVSVSHVFTQRLSGQVFSRINVNDYLFGIRRDPVLAFFAPSVEPDARRRRNRDGFQTDVGVEGTYQVGASDTTVRVGTAYERYQAEGRDWSRHGSRTWVELQQPLPLDLRLDLRGSFSYHPYDHRSSHLRAIKFATGGGPKRLDKIYEVETRLSYPVTDWLELTARARYTHDSSNVRVYDIERWTAGGYFTLFWDNF